MDYKAELLKAGRLTIPAELRREMNLSEGDSLVIRCENGEMRLLTQQQLLAEAQAIVRKYVPSDVSLVDALVQERRLEVRKDAEEFQHVQEHYKKPPA